MPNNVKFGRNYVLLVQDNTPDMDYISIEPPFTLEFDISRSTLSSVNTATFRIYNLGKNARNLLLKDAWNYDIYRNVTFQAGYGSSNNFPIVFSGNIQECWSVREGNNFITQIQCQDGGYGFSNAVYNQPQFAAGTPQQKIINAMIDSLKPYHIAPGSIGTYNGTISTPSAYDGNTTELLRDLTGGGFFIDNGKAHALNDWEVIAPGGAQFIFTSPGAPPTIILPSPPIINVDSGLLGTPTVELLNIHFDVLFEPSLICGQSIQLQSQTLPIYEGVYKILSLHHRGTISTAICGDAVTTIGAFLPAINPNPITYVANS